MRLFSMAVQSRGWGCSIHHHFGADGADRTRRPISPGNRSAQNPAYRSAADLETLPVANRTKFHPCYTRLRLRKSGTTRQAPSERLVWAPGDRREAAVEVI